MLRKFIAAALLFCFTVSYHALPAQAVEIGTISISYHDAKGNYLAEVPWEVFHLYTIKGENLYVPTDKHSALGELQDLTDNEKWSIQTQTANNYINALSITADFKGTTDDMGRAVVTGLEKGVYLLRFDKTRVGNYTYETDPIMLTVPGSIITDEEWNQNIIPKVLENYSPEQDVLRDITVNKVWREDSNQDVRPSSLTVELYKNGSIYDSFDLTESSSWSKTWTNLESSATWAVLEPEIPYGYSVSYQYNDQVFTIQNTYDAPIIGGGDSFGVGGGSGTDANVGHDTDVEGALTQTGALVWPIYVLSTVGLCLIAVGILLRGGKKHEEESI